MQSEYIRIDLKNLFIEKECDLESTIEHLRESFYILDNSMERNEVWLCLELYKLSFYMVAYTDLYILLTHKLKENRLTEEDYYILSITDDITCMDDLEDVLDYNDLFLKRMVISSLEIEELPYLSRYHMFHLLNKEDKAYLSFMSIHFDMEDSLYEKDITIEDLTSYFEEKQNLPKRSDLVDSVSKINIIEELRGFLQNLTKYNYDNFFTIVLDMSKYYYKWCKYTVDHKKEIEELEDEKLFIHTYDTEDIETLIQDILYDEEFFFYLILFNIETRKRKQRNTKEGSIITEEEVKTYAKQFKDKK